MHLPQTQAPLDRHFTIVTPLGSRSRVTQWDKNYFLKLRVASNRRSHPLQTFHSQNWLGQPDVPSVQLCFEWPKIGGEAPLLIVIGISTTENIATPRVSA